MWTLCLIVAFAVYVYVLVLLAKEWHQRNPYWYTARVIEFAKTYWVWPVLAVWIVGGIAWELWKTRKERKEIRDKYGL